MTGQLDMFRAGLERTHDNLEYPVATFTNFTQTGVDRGQPTGSYDTSDTADVAIIPPAADSTVDTEGTHLDFSTSIRAPQADLDSLSVDLIDYGEDKKRPTRVTIQGETYEMQSIIPEHGSDMYLIRLTEV